MSTTPLAALTVDRRRRRIFQHIDRFDVAGENYIDVAGGRHRR